MTSALLYLCFDELGFCLVVVGVDMGCGGSKVDELPLVTLSRKRKELIRAAADHRYALAAAHLAYFSSLKDVGDALRRFVDEEIVIASSSASVSVLDSPVLTLPSDEGKKSKKKKGSGYGNNHSDSNNNVKILSSTSTSMSHSGSLSHHRNEDHGDMENSHLHLSSDSDSQLDSGHIHIRDSPEVERRRYSPPPNQTAWGSYGMNPLPQANWGSYGFDPLPQTAWGSYESNLPPQTGWGSYESYPPPQTGWGSYESNPPQSSWGSYVMNLPPQGSWEQYGGSSNTRAYYMRKSGPAIRTVIHEEEPRMMVGAEQWGGQSYGYSSSYSNYPNENAGFFGMPAGLPPAQERRPPPPAGPPPPPSPKVSAWDFLNPFDVYDSGYPGYYSQSKYSQGSIASSPDSNEVREREGIPDLEEETENEIISEVKKSKNLNEDRRRNHGTPRAAPRPQQKSDEMRKSNRSAGTSRGVPQQKNEAGTSRGVPAQKNEGTSRSIHSHNSEGSPEAVPSQISDDTPRAGNSESSELTHSVDTNVIGKDEKNSSDTIVSTSPEEDYVKKKGVSFEVDDLSTHDVDSSRFSSLTTLSANGTRDLQEVVTEIRDEFEIASSNGKEVAVMLEVGKLPYQPKLTALKVIISRILYLISPSFSSSDPPSQSVQLNSRTMEMARSYYEDNGKGVNLNPINLSSTLEKLYVWEKKLHKEIKDEERLRVTYEKMCKRLKILDERGAESSKIDATNASIRRLLTKLDVCINTIDAISSRIHKLRDEELQPQVSELIHGLIRMWKSMLKCHQKQFQAIKDSKLQKLKANTGFRTDSSLRATRDLETELNTWCSHFNDWITAQKLYVESLNGWLLRYLNHEPEITADGLAPFSPGRIGAPPIFIICNDWSQAMETVSESGVKRALNSFASDVHRLYERQDDEHRQRLKAEDLYKDFENRMMRLKAEKGKTKPKTGHHDETGGSGGSIVTSENGVSPLDDLKVDLDSIRKKLEEERARHKDAVKLVHDAASSSLQGGLVPIFKSLENFTSEALKAHEQVRIEIAGEGS